MDQAILAAWVTAAVTLGGVLIALLGVWWQIRRQWILNSANMITALGDRFSSREWREYRMACAAIIQRKESHAIGLSTDFPVLGFFENLAHLVLRGAIDKVMVWNKFGWYITRYHMALTVGRNLIEENRRSENDPTLWEEFEKLNQEMIKIYEAKGIRVADPAMRVPRIQELLRQEANLLELLVPAPDGSLPHQTQVPASLATEPRKEPTR